MKAVKNGFFAKGATKKVVPAYAYNSGRGSMAFTTNKGYADAMNKKFGVVLPAREEFGGAA